jgi:opacity protein-like surface antigen
MKRNKLVLFSVCLSLIATLASAQSGFTLEASQLYASFKFKDSEAAKLNNEYSGLFTGGYGIGFRYISEGGFIVRLGVGMRNAGANLLYDDMNYSWKLQYGDVKPGIGYMIKINRVNPYLTVSGYFAYLLRGTQTLNNEDFNITESGLLNRFDMGVIFNPGVEFKLSDYVSAFTEFNYLWGLKNLETDADQTASNFAYAITLGLSFTITK